MGERYGTCTKCGESIVKGENPYICDSCLALEPQGKKYICMKCGKVYSDKTGLPTTGNGDGCCSIGSLIEVDK